MAGKSERYNVADATLEKRIGCVKYTIFCFNVVAWIFGAAQFAVSVWIRSEPGFQDWIDILNIRVYNTGIYVLILSSIIVMIIAFLGCVSSLLENVFAIGLFIATQLLSFVLLTVGTAVLMEFSTTNSSVQPIIRETMNRFIMTSEYPTSHSTLKMIQENIGCCGADGPNDYIVLRQPLPSECRDTVTGNAFFHGCVDELTWFLEDKSAWLTGIAMAIALMNVVNAVLSIILVQALKKEENEARTYRR